MLLGMFAVLAIFAIAVACGDDDDSNTNNSNSSSPSASNTKAPSTAGQPQKGGEITVQYLEFQSFDPHFSSFAQDIGHEGMVWRGLYRLDKDAKVQTEAAAAMPAVTDGGKTYTIKLKPGQKWSDGQPLTAKDFVAAIQRTCNPDVAGQYQFILSVVQGCDAYAAANGNPKANPPVPAKSDVEKADLLKAVGVSATDDTTIVFKLTDPSPTFTTILALWPTWPVPTHIVKNPGDPWPAPDKLAFNGPFKVQSYAQKNNMVLVRNDNFGGSHLAYLDKVTFKYIDDTETANNAYRNNELVMALANTANFDVLKADPKLSKELVTTPKASTIGLQMNMEHKPLDNEKVRLALSQAIDRETLNKVVLQNSVVPTTSWVPEDLLGLQPNPWKADIGFNAAAAKKNLADAGYPDGKGFPTLGFLTRDTPANKATAEFIKQAFKTILNIDINVEIVDAPTRSKRFSEENFDLFPGGWNQDYPDPENWILGQYETGGALNHYNCSNPKIDDLVNKARFNQNNEERISQYKQINELISKDLCGIAVLYHQANNYLISPTLHGAKENSTTQDKVLAGDWIAEDWWVSK
jgi:oligopeptide transport system substrate-binding protein